MNALTSLAPRVLAVLALLTLSSNVSLARDEELTASIPLTVEFGTVEVLSRLTANNDKHATEAIEASIAALRVEADTVAELPAAATDFEVLELNKGELSPAENIEAEPAS
jgi:hypothetical protein